MASVKKVKILDLALIAGGSISVSAGDFTSPIAPGDYFLKYRLTGSVSLSSSLGVVVTGTPVKNTSLTFHYEGSITPSGSVFSILGQSVPDELLSSKFVAECIYDGAAWKVKLLPSFDGSGIIGSHRLASDSVTTTSIADNSVTLAKMAGLAKGKIIYGDASGNPADIELGSADGRMLLGDTAAGVAAVDMSGDATITKAGALTIASNAVTTAKILDANVTPAKMSAGARKASIAIPVSFETAGEIGVVKYTMCFDCTVDAIHATVTKAAATDTATAIFKDHGGTVLTGSQVDITTGLVLGNIVSTTPTANNTFTAGEQITIETSKTTAGSGNFTAILCLTHD
jgi:hypothetical protein